MKTFFLGIKKTINFFSPLSKIILVLALGTFAYFQAVVIPNLQNQTVSLNTGDNVKILGGGSKSGNNSLVKGEQTQNDSNQLSNTAFDTTQTDNLNNSGVNTDAPSGRLYAFAKITDPSPSFANYGYISGDLIIKKDTGMLRVKPNAIDSEKIRWHSIRSEDLASGSVTSRIIKNGTIQGEDISTKADLEIQSLTVSGSSNLTGSLVAVGPLQITGGNLILGANTLTTTNTTLVSNLNADYLDGQHGAYYLPTGNISGATNYISKFTGASSLGNSLLYDNGTSVGIGTTVPLAKLHIDDNRTTADAIGFYVNKTGANVGTQYGIDVSATDAAVTNVAGYFTANNGTNNRGVQITSVAAGATNYAIYSDAAAQSYIRGNVGIGTTSPVSMLSVGASSQFQVNSTGNIVLLNNVITSFPSAQGIAGSIMTNNGSGTLTWGSPAGTGTLGYWQRNGTSLAPSNIGDNVGIGTTGPNYKLEVDDINRTLNHVNLSVLTTDSMAVDLGGTIGLGGVYTGTSKTSFGSIRGAKENVTDNNYNGYLAFNTVHTTLNGGVLSEKMRITSSGNVGIGTTNPQKKLEINDADSNTTTSGLRFTNFACTGNDKLTVGAGGDVICGTDQIGSGTGNIVDTLAQTLGAANDANALDINNIGKLYVALGTVGVPTYSFQSDTDTGLWSSAANTLNFSTNGAERMRIDNTGNVGIGTTAPGFNLHVNSSFGVLGTVSGGVAFAVTDGSTYSNIYSNKYAEMRISSSVNNTSFMSFYTRTSAVNNERMRIDNNGNVGIGTTAPDTTLKVVGSICAKATGAACFGTTAGNIYAANFIVDGTYHLPDYVFDPNYAFLSISDLKNYIAANKHLPGVPSASEVNKNGLNLGLMVPAILEKTEENTLYIIDNYNQIKEQKNQISGLTDNQNKVVEQLTGQLTYQLADQERSIDSKIQLIGASLDKLSTQQIATIKEQIADQKTRVVDLEKQMADIKSAMYVERYDELWNFYLIFKPESLANIVFKENGNINLLDGKITAQDIEALGIVKAKSIEAEDIAASKSLKLGKEIRGTGEIKAGDTEIKIETVEASPGVQIYITPLGQLNGRSLYVDMEKLEDGKSFNVKLDGEPLSKDIKFNWLIIQ